MTRNRLILGAALDEAEAQPRQVLKRLPRELHLGHTIVI